MNLPGFTAESSLGPAMGNYGGATISGTSRGGVVPSQRLMVAPGLLRTRVMRCCVVIGGKPECHVREVLRWQNCRCEKGLVVCDGEDPYIQRFEGF